MNKNTCLKCKHFSPARWQVSFSPSNGDKITDSLSTIELAGRFSSLNGHCHRYPPEHGKPFPEVYSNCHCGEFKRKATS